MTPKGYHHSEETKEKLRKKKIGNKNPSWKGNDVSYNGLHRWFRENYGKADRCINTECNGVSKKYVYALKKGYVHRRNIKNYMMLCEPCHKKYDLGGIPRKQETKNKISITNKKRWKERKQSLHRVLI